MEKVHHIGLQSSILGQYMAEIRATAVQQDRLRFRHNLSRIAEILSYEMSKTCHLFKKKCKLRLVLPKLRFPLNNRSYLPFCAQV